MTMTSQIEAIARYEKAIEAHNETGEELESAAEQFVKVATLAQFPNADALIVRGDAGDEFDTVLSPAGIRNGSMVLKDESVNLDSLSEHLNDALLTLVSLGWTQLGDYEIPLR